MHEYALCERLVDAVRQELARLDPPPPVLRRVRVVVGALHQVVPDYLETAYEVLTRETPLAGSRLDLVSRPVVARCNACKGEGEIEVPFFQCGACGSLDLEVIGGKELYLESLEVEEAG